ncbi:signal peptidase I [Paramicrobacterium chengjingii]|uniref:signal peptidase I n=1 Tax=Paramicrobacterium chengjingii TaxID=2769067 RepID=UPI0014245AFA|nr:signal peptidase I [Microbacterium chengjingii]
MQPSVTETSEPKASRAWRKIASSFWFNLLAAIVVLALIQTFIVKLYYVPSASMETTLDVGDRMLVSRLAYVGADPAAGDIVVFNASDLWDEAEPVPENPLVYGVKWLGGLLGVGPSLEHTLVKRIVAAPGDIVSCCGDDGKLRVNGSPLSEPYVTNAIPFEFGTLDCVSEPASKRCVPEFTVPSGQYVVLGDNRGNSADSLQACRGQLTMGDCLKTVSRDDIVGKMFVTLFPLSRFGAPLG